jgi:hypothetical protein
MFFLNLSKICYYRGCLLIFVKYLLFLFYFVSFNKVNIFVSVKSNNMKKLENLTSKKILTRKRSMKEKVYRWILSQQQITSLHIVRQIMACFV